MAVEATIYPVAIRYHDTSGELSKAPVYVDVSLLESIGQILQQPWIEVELIFADPVNSSGKNRQELARTTQQIITNTLSPQMSPHKEPEKPSYLPVE